MEIEFLDPDPEPFPAAEPASDPGDRREAALRLGRAYAPAVLWAAAAVLAVVAPFRVIDTITVRQSGQTQRESTDGWGHYRSLGGASALAHGPRYGVVLLVAGALLAAAALLALLPAVGRPAGPGLARLRTALGIAGTGALATLVAVLVLNYLSTKDTLDAQVTSFGSSAPGTLVDEVITAHVRFGGCMWLGVAALACTLLAVAADVTSPAGTRPEPADDEEQFPPALEAAPDPQDDLLESGPTA